MKQKELEQLLLEVADLNSDYNYITFKAPELLRKMQAVNKIPKELEDEYDTALREIEYLENNI